MSSGFSSVALQPPVFDVGTSDASVRNAQPSLRVCIPRGAGNNLCTVDKHYSSKMWSLRSWHLYEYNKSCDSIKVSEREWDWAPCSSRHGPWAIQSKSCKTRFVSAKQYASHCNSTSNTNVLYIWSDYRREYHQVLESLSNWWLIPRSDDPFSFFRPGRTVQS